MRSTITARGQTVIPAKIRHKYKLSPSMGLEWIDDGDTIRVVPVRKNAINAFRGSGKGEGVDNLLQERAKDRLQE